MSWFGGGRPTPRATLNRQQQIETLKQHNPYVVGVADDPNSFDIGLKLPNGCIIRVRTTLPGGFPDNGLPPTVRIVEAPTTHMWLDAQQRVVGSPELSTWNPSKSLGAVVLSIIQYFGTSPPLYTPAAGPGAGASARQLMPGPYAAQAAASSASSNQNSVGGGAQAGGPSSRQQPGQQPAQNSSAEDSVASGGTRGGRPVSSRSHTAVPPLPSEFPELKSMSLDEIQALTGDSVARKDFIDEQESVAVFKSLAVSTREEAAKLAQSNLDASNEIAELRDQLKALQSNNGSKAEELKKLLAKKQAVLSRFEPNRLARDLELTAQEIDNQSESLAEAFCDPEAPPFGGLTASNSFGDSISVYGGGGGFDDSRSVFSSSGGGGGGASTIAGATNPAVTAALREFRDEFLALRKRYHMAHAKVELLQQGGLSSSSNAPAGGAASR